tara:strand:+ start:51 stop:1118 length:1068 start_codon:yes stop_codon:yes gene_type:complete
VKVVVATIVHHPEDARIHYRQIPALLAAGNEVVYVAPSSDRDLERPGLVHREVPRALGRRRWSALRRAASVLAEETPTAAVTILHDPELTLLRRSITGPAIFDMHEDLPAQVRDKAWIPGPVRPAVALAARSWERWVARRLHLVLAEEVYRVRHGDRPVVRNTPVVPERVAPSGPDRVVYLGRVSLSRGLETMLGAVAAVDGVALDLYGPVDPSAKRILDQEREDVRVHGFVPNPSALSAIEGAQAGLALLDDRPNYRDSVPTKILEYMARGVPVITTPNPVARRIVEHADAGIVVPYGDVGALVEAIELLGDADLRERFARNGRAAVRDRYDWSADAREFVSLVEEVARQGADS